MQTYINDNDIYFNTMGIKKIQKMVKIGNSSYICVPVDVKKKLEKNNGDDMPVTFGDE